MHTTISVKMLVIIFEVLRNGDCLSAPQTDPELGQAYVVWLPHLTTPPFPPNALSYCLLFQQHDVTLPSGQS